VGVVFRGNHERAGWCFRRRREGDGAKQAEGNEVGKRPENGKDFSNHIRAAGETGGTDCERIRHDSGASSGLSLIIPEWKAAQ